MMKVKVIGRDNVGWSIDKDRSNLLHFLSQKGGVEVIDSYFKADIYFFVWLDLVRSPRYFLPRFFRKVFGKKIISWVTNDISQNKAFAKQKWPVDLFISPSARVSRFLDGQGLPYVQIPFYVSPENYKKLSLSKEDVAKSLGIDFNKIRDKFLIGSFQRDSLGGDLSKPKWQKDPDLLIDICETLPKDKFVLVLAGPRRHYLIHKCREKNIPYIFIGDESFINEKKDDIFENNLSDEKINLLYNLIDLYLVTSKSEGGPKAVMEAALSETLIFSTDVGLAPDFLHEDLLFSKEDFGKVVDLVLGKISKDKIRSYKEYNLEKVTLILGQEHYQSMIKGAIEKVK